MRQSRGFTLLELVIVMGILAFLSINIAVNIQNAFKARTRIQTKLEDFSRVRDALRIIEKDLNLAFHYRDLEDEFRKELKKAQATPTPTPVPGAPPGFQQPPQAQAPVDQAEATWKRNRVDPTTQFIGTENQMDFVTMNTTRLAQDQAQADFIEVGYALKPCRRPGSESTTECLVRRESALVEGKVNEGGEENVLLEDVTEFNLRYFGQGKQDWNTSWSSEADDGATKNNYPQAVEISLTVERGDGPKKRKVSMQIVAAVRFPNNAPKQNQTSAPSSGGIPGM